MNLKQFQGHLRRLVIEGILKALFLGVVTGAGAAFISGINVKRRKILHYTLNGLITGFAALVLLSRLGSATPTMGDGYEMSAISACAIGGITLTGGVGSAIGAFLGVLFLGIVRNGLNLMGVPTFYQYLVNGAIIIVAVLFSNYTAKKKS